MRSNRFRCLGVLWAIAGLFSLSRPLRADDGHDLYQTLALSPYQCRLHVVWERSAVDTPDRVAVFEAEFLRGLRRVVGESWAIHVQSSEQSTLGDLTRLSKNLAAADPPESDKSIVVSIHRAANGWDVTATEFDRRTQTWSPEVSRAALQAADLSIAAIVNVKEVFQPLFRVVAVNDDEIRMIARAGELAPPDPDFAPLEIGNIARPSLFFFDRDQELQQIQSLPLTYLAITSSERGWISARTVSAFRAPLGGARRNRVEIWALGGRPSAQESVVRLTRQDDPSRVLMGQRVVVSPRMFLPDQPAEEPFERLSNRQGELRLVRRESSPVLWLYVWSGEALLARVPYVPGWEPVTELSLPDDTIRLRVEGELERLKGDLVENVARRAVLRSQALRAAKLQDAQEARNLLDGLREVPGEQAFLQQLNFIRTAAVREAKAARQRVAEIRISQSCAALEDSIRNFLAPERQKQAIEEVEALLELEAP